MRAAGWRATYIAAAARNHSSPTRRATRREVGLQGVDAAFHHGVAIDREAGLAHERGDVRSTACIGSGSEQGAREGILKALQRTVRRRIGSSPVAVQAASRSGARASSARCALGEQCREIGHVAVALDEGRARPDARRSAARYSSHTSGATGASCESISRASPRLGSGVWPARWISITGSPGNAIDIGLAPNSPGCARRHRRY